MRARHSAHSLTNYPVYSSTFVSDDRLVLGGGGGATRSGVKNRLRLYEVKSETDVNLLDEFELQKDEDVPMSIALVPETKEIVCGINGSEDQIKKGENPNCRLFSTINDKLSLSKVQATLSTRDPLVYQKASAASLDSKYVAAAAQHEVSVLSLPDLGKAFSVSLPDSEIYDASFSPSSLMIATTTRIYVYPLPEDTKDVSDSPSKEVSLPSLPGVTGGCTFRAARYNPQNPSMVYALLNTTPSRTARSNARRAFVCKYNATTWKVEKVRKIGDKGATCFDISADGKLLAFGSSDLTIGILDAQTLAPLLTVLKAHDFPPTTLKFNPSGKLLVSGSADNTIRVIVVPQFGGSSWTVVLVIIISILALLLAILFQYLQRA